MTTDRQTLAPFDPIPYVPVAIVGGGPGGTGPVLAAAQKGCLADLLDAGVTIFEAGDSLIDGSLGSLGVNSDTLSNAFLEILDNDPDGWFTDLRVEPETLALRSYDGVPSPLHEVGAFLRLLGRRLEVIMNSFPRSSVRLGESVTAAVRVRSGYLLTVQKSAVDDSGRPAVTSSIVHCSKLVIATGGAQDLRKARQCPVRGLQRSYGSIDGMLAGGPVELATSGRVLTEPTGAELRDRLSKVTDPRVVIIGGSHSAFSAAWSLLREGLGLGSRSVQLFYRRPPKPFFADRAAALEAGYLDVSDDDICPVTGRVFRLAGLRFDGRELLLRTLRLDGLEPDPRFVMRSLDESDVDLACELQQADLIIPAFGYAPRALPIVAEGRRMALLADHGGPFVNDACQVLDADASPVPDVYAIGLASGFVPSGNLGGEPSFRGQTNGYWLYQNGVGEIILNQLTPNVDLRMQPEEERC